MIVSQGNLLAQMPSFFGSPSAPAKPAVSTPASTASEPTTPQSPGATTNPTAAFSSALYDPNMDNHLVAPSQGSEIGIFGMPIGRVEDLLRANGARNYSYVFGKYSRMALSVYIVTIYFDRRRAVGGISVEPRKPYQSIEPEARKFFMDLFLNNGDLSKFEANISSARFELKYRP